MECFDDLVGVRGLCNETTPKSEIYLDDVGLTKQDLLAFIPPQYSNLEDYFSKRSQFAYKTIATEIYNHFRSKYLAYSLIDSHRLGYFNQSLTTNLGANFRGINMQFTQSGGFYSFTISEINLYLNYTGDVDVVIYDLYQNKLLHTVTVPCVSGKISTAYIHKQFESQKRPANIFIGYNSDGITAINTPIKSGLCCGKTSCDNSYMTAQGAEIDGTFITSNMDTINQTAGVSLVYSVECDHLSWICSHGKALSIPAAYKIAEIVTTDALLHNGGERASNSHTIDKDELEKRALFFSRKYNETVGNLLSNMQLPSNKCFQCNSPSRTVIALP
ncbi:MAG: hypothetical protein BWY67_01823 [Bacteroidetes bacterium ADurb.Bin397]|nr:MAG: hypothetical protein BWY67_01823 [Bacteroidetes bacterium ADurb.Bin397]